MSVGYLLMKQKACILLGVWGESYIDEFFQYSLPSLLAPGNIPALAKAYDTRFVFLSKQKDTSYFEKQRAYKSLDCACSVEFLAIDDLIVDGNYSTTLTLAFDRAIKLTRAAMLDTYFIFLTSDYVMANGSFLGLMRYMQKGYSGICAGNFQVNDSGVRPALKKCLDKKTGVLSIEPRELLKISFEHLHLMTVASLVNQATLHNYRANRFFYRQNDMVVGRFFLLHMLCIKPEKMDYTIGASCDYSFIPEMCPSGNIGVINDSDDYLVVEMQPENHEVTSVSIGAYQHNHLIRALREWTTQQHRENSQYPIYYHVEDLRNSDLAVIEQHLDDFIAPIMSALGKSKPVKHRSHPYWLSAIKAFNYERKKKGYAILGNKQRFGWLIPKRLNQVLFGSPPMVYPWHFQWYEYYLTKKILHTQITEDPNRSMLLYDPDFIAYNNWFRKVLNVRKQYPLTCLGHSKTLAELNHYSIAHCILILNLEGLADIDKIITQISLFLHPDGVIDIVVFNEYTKNGYTELFFKQEVFSKIPILIGAVNAISSYALVSNNLTIISHWISKLINRWFIHNRILKYIAYTMSALGLGLFVLIRNLWVWLFRMNFGFCTAVVFKVKPNTLMRGIDVDSE